ncbi:MAG: SH3-like domain-containing protein [Pikeienuella sp.]
MTAELPEVSEAAVPPPYPSGQTRFAPGAAVRVRRGDAPGHLRTPWYVRGCRGRIERICGAFPNPEELAYGRPGLPALPLYRVRFSMTELWGDTAAAGDTVDVEIYEHWLEPDHGA